MTRYYVKAVKGKLEQKRLKNNTSELVSRKIIRVVSALDASCGVVQLCDSYYNDDLVKSLRLSPFTGYDNKFLDEQRILQKL